MANERLDAQDNVSLTLIGPDGQVKSNTTGNTSDNEARKRVLAALVSRLLNLR
jgi:hypothetical protein